MAGTIWRAGAKNDIPARAIAGLAAVATPIAPAWALPQDFPASRHLADIAPNLVWEAAIAAIVTTARHSPEATGVLAKSASGALEMVPVVTVQNLARALTEMNDQGFMTVGLDSKGGENLGEIVLRQPLALVLGAEGKGLRQLTRDTCSILARLDVPGEIKSLNVSNAAVLALYIGAFKLGLMS